MKLKVLKLQQRHHTNLSTTKFLSSFSYSYIWKLPYFLQLSKYAMTFSCPRPKSFPFSSRYVKFSSDKICVPRYSVPNLCFFKPIMEIAFKSSAENPLFLFLPYFSCQIYHNTIQCSSKINWPWQKQSKVTCHVKNRFESQTKSSDFHRILHFNAVTNQPNSFPILCSEKGVVVGI